MCVVANSPQHVTHAAADSVFRWFDVTSERCFEADLVCEAAVFDTVELAPACVVAHIIIIELGVDPHHNIMLAVRLLRGFSAYRPLRPLNKEGLTVLYKRNRLPDLTWIPTLPAGGVLANNLLTGFTLLNTGVMSIVLLASSYLRARAKRWRASQAISLSTNSTFDKFWLEVEFY